MKRSLLFLCIAFAVICLLRRSSEESIDHSALCGKDIWNKYHILSVFNLKDELIIQGLENGETTSEFWRVYRTEGEVQKSVSKELVVTNFKNTHGWFIPSRENLDKPGEIYSAHDIDLSKPIFGYIAPISTDYWENCTNQISPIKIDEEGCQRIDEMLNNNHEDFVCIHGTLNNTIDRVSTNVFYYNSHDGRLWHIRSQPLRDLVNLSCVTHSGYMNNVKPQGNPLPPTPLMTAFVNWPLSGYRSDTFANMSLVYFKFLHTDRTSLIRLEPMIVGNTTDIRSHYITNYSPRDHYFMFRFNQYYKYMFGGQQFTLKSSLSWWTYNETSDSFKEDYGAITLKDLLGCPLPYPTFEPNQFCRNQMHFKSVFNLGKDIYFHAVGRFWRYPFNRHRFEAESYGINNKYNIRFESEFAAQLVRDGFNLLYPFDGFTFIPHTSSYCRLVDDKCNKRYADSGQYLVACIYGYQTYFYRKFSYNSKILRTYYYTPGGLTPLRYDRNATHLFCHSLLSYGTNPLVYPLSQITQFPQSLHNSTDKNIVFAEYVTPDQSILVQIEWAINFDITDKSYKEIKKIELFRRERTNTMLFYLYRSLNGEDIKGYGYEVNKKNEVIYSRFVAKNGTFQPIPEFTATHSLFECTFHSSYSLVSFNKEKVCPRHKTYSAESVFTIGHNIVHQMGLNFYMFNGKRFIYDRDSSDLFNDYFDTRHRLTGYSYPLEGVDPDDFKVFEVVIHGKSAQRYHHLGKYIFVVFQYDKDLPYYLKIVNDKHFSSLMINNTVDIDRHYKGTKFINHMCSVISSNIKVFIWYWVREEREKWRYFAYESQDWLRILRDPNKTKQPLPLNRWKHPVDIERPSFENIVGCYTDWPTNKIMFVAQDRKDKKEWVYEAVTNPGSVPSFNELTNYRRTDKYYTWTCDADDSESQSSDSSSGSKTLNTIFSVLLLILMVLSLIIGYYVYQKNEKSKGISKPNSKKNEEPNVDNASVDTLDPNRPNYTVVRQPPTNAESISIAESGAEKSVRSEKI